MRRNHHLSQYMAEGWGRSLKGDLYNFYSEGTKKHRLNSNAVKVMLEAGGDNSNYESNTPEELPGATIHVGFDDPPRMTREMNNKEEFLEVYRRGRDEIKVMVRNIEKYL